MPTRRAFQTIALAGSLLGLSAAALVASYRAHETHSPTAQPTSGSATVRSLIAGGGSTPESNEFSIEEDLLVASEILPGPTRLLYANGADTRAVRVDAESERGDPLLAELGRIFAPRPGRTSTYRATRLKPDGPTTPGRFLDELMYAVTEPTDAPLTVYVAGHGSPAETRDQTSVAMWGNRALQARDVRDALSKARPLSRDVRFIVTTCFGGGFAEVAFPETGPLVSADSTVCGLFATRWDREAGGCDPNPERGRHDGYGVHFLNALGASPAAFGGTPSTSWKGNSASPAAFGGTPSTSWKGNSASPAAFGGTTSWKGNSASPVGTASSSTKGSPDIVGDGTISFLDAHTWARLRSGSLDVPTTTSERFLRLAVPADASATDVGVDLPHEQRVIAALTDRLNVETEEAARAEIDHLLQRTEQLVVRETAVAQAESDAFHDASAELLARWPVLDDPWHPEWASTVENHRGEIASFLEQSPEVAALHRAMAETDSVAGQRAELEVRVAPYMRLARAFETMRLARALKAAQPDDWATFEALRRCEDSSP